jgi:hypothetical protein
MDAPCCHTSKLKRRSKQKRPVQRHRVRLSRIVLWRLCSEGKGKSLQRMQHATPRYRRQPSDRRLAYREMHLVMLQAVMQRLEGQENPRGV